MKAPATQLYWKEWAGDLALARCSLAAQGAWMRILAVLHQSDEYGVLRWPLAEIASTANVPLRYARELATKNVLKGSDALEQDFIHIPRHAGRNGDPVVLVQADGGSCWFSARFVRDEWARGRRGNGSRFTPDNQPSRSPIGRTGDRQGDGPASAFASASAGIDTLQRADTPLGEAEDLARALRGIQGYGECSGFAPPLLEARAAGVTAEQITAIAREKPGKSLAYIAKTAIGRLQDRQPSGQGGSAQPPAVDAEAQAKREELRRVEASLIELRHLRNVLGMIEPIEYEERRAPLLARQAELLAELQPRAAVGGAS